MQPTNSVKTLPQWDWGPQSKKWLFFPLSEVLLVQANSRRSVVSMRDPILEPVYCKRRQSAKEKPHGEASKPAWSHPNQLTTTVHWLHLVLLINCFVVHVLNLRLVKYGLVKLR